MSASPGPSARRPAATRRPRRRSRRAGASSAMRCGPAVAVTFSSLVDCSIACTPTSHDRRRAARERPHGADLAAHDREDLERRDERRVGGVRRGGEVLLRGAQLAEALARGSARPGRAAAAPTGAGRGPTARGGGPAPPGSPAIAVQTTTTTTTAEDDPAATARRRRRRRAPAATPARRTSRADRTGPSGGSRRARTPPEDPSLVHGWPRIRPISAGVGRAAPDARTHRRRVSPARRYRRRRWTTTCPG